MLSIEELLHAVKPPFNSLFEMPKKKSAKPPRKQPLFEKTFNSLFEMLASSMSNSILWFFILSILYLRCCYYAHYPSLRISAFNSLFEMRRMP